jgi:hypothetical protein
MTPLELPQVAARWQRWSLLCGVVGSALCVAGWAWFPAAFYPAYLAALLFWLGIALGCQAVVMLHHLTGGGWGLPIRRLQEATFANFLLLAILFLPLALNLPAIYPWARLESSEQRASDYLTADFFQLRAAIYFAIWTILGLALNWLSSGTRPKDEPIRQRRLGLLAGPGLILWAITITFSSIDWAMSLEPHWFSTMYGVLFMGGDGVAGLAFAIIAALGLRGVTHWPFLLTRDRMNDLGNLLLAFVMFWSYACFMQYLIIWSGNLPEETPWYLRRATGIWQLVAFSLAVLHFVLPFLLLLYRQTKRKPVWLASVAGLLLVMRYVDLLWLIMPAVSPEVHVLWLCPAALAAIGGWWLSLFAWRLPTRASLPVYELKEQEAGHEHVPHAAH